jgi:hypothetical protein
MPEQGKTKKIYFNLTIPEIFRVMLADSPVWSWPSRMQCLRGNGRKKYSVLANYVKMHGFAEKPCRVKYNYRQALFATRTRN